MAHRQRIAGSSVQPDKVCVACGRRIQRRAKWARDWHTVRYCSGACRSRGVTETDRMLADAILALLAERPSGASILVSDAARAVAAGRWEDLAEPARRAARRLVDAGSIEILQGGRVVDGSTAKGPIEARLR